MADDDVKILAPDHSLIKKLGTLNLDQVFSPQAVETAQKVIEKSSDNLMQESTDNAQKLGRLGQDLRAEPARASKLLPLIIAEAFSLKSKAGMADYQLVANLAKSLNFVCEMIDATSIKSSHIQIITWHIDSIRTVIGLKIKGDGGTMAAAMQKELEQIRMMFLPSQSVPTTKP
jgi:hypothetical protein